MHNKDYGMLTSLGLLAVFIWFRDTAWMSSSDDTLPILVALPVFVWLGWPWQFKSEGAFTFSAKRIVFITLLSTVELVVSTFTARKCGSDAEASCTSDHGIPLGNARHANARMVVSTVGSLDHCPPLLLRRI